jgi:NHL repeat
MMRLWYLSRYALVTYVAAAFLADCSGGSQPPIGAPGMTPQSRAIAREADRGGLWMRPNVEDSSSKSLLYVDDTIGNAVYVYQLNRRGASKIGKITKGVTSPFASTIDASGNLYVVNRVVYGNVAIYAPGASSPSLVLRQGLTYPQGVAVDPNGNVWVTNRSNSNPGIAVFPPGQTKPSAYITGNLIRYPLEAVFDEQGDLYFADLETGVSEIPAGTQRPISLRLKELRHHSATGIAFSTSDKLYVDNYDPNHGQVYTTLVYSIGNPNPDAKLKVHVHGNNIAAGDVDNKDDVFVPDWYSGKVYVYRDGKRAPFETLNTAAKGIGGVWVASPPDAPR